MTISLQGFGSGIDTAALVQALLSNERAAITRTQTRVSNTKLMAQAIRDINSRLATLLSKARTLTPENLQLKKATTDTPSTSQPFVSVAAGSSAATGTFTVDVTNLATATSVTSTGAVGSAVTKTAVLASAGFGTTITTGTFSINGTSFTIDASTVLSDGVDAPGANTILAKINDAGIGVTASLANDADGRENKLTLTSASSIQLGAGGDTSNFLAAAKLLASPAGTTRTSTGNMGVVSTTAVLTSSRLVESLGASSGSFTINGVSVSWDSAVDSINDVISRVNASTAGVVMSYDSANDKFRLDSKTTGSTVISLADTTGTFLQAMKATAATQTVGVNAAYAINGGATQYSTSNTVTDAVAGATITLLAQTTSAVTVTVGLDTDAITQKVKDFVAQYNSAADLVRQKTAYVQGGTNGILFGDSGMTSILSRLHRTVTSTPTGVTGTYTALGQIGISFGGFGSAVGATSTLQFDEQKFKDALNADLGGVTRLLTADSGGVIGMATEIETYLDELTKYGGTLPGRATQQDDRVRTLNSQITRMQDSLALRQKNLERKFQQMEQALARLQQQQGQIASLGLL